MKAPRATGSPFAVTSTSQNLMLLPALVQRPTAIRSTPLATERNCALEAIVTFVCPGSHVSWAVADASPPATSISVISAPPCTIPNEREIASRNGSRTVTMPCSMASTRMPASAVKGVASAVLRISSAMSAGNGLAAREDMLPGILRGCGARVWPRPDFVTGREVLAP